MNYLGGKNGAARYANGNRARDLDKAVSGVCLRALPLDCL